MSNQASSVDSTRVSYGRGGAGNISRQNAGSPGPDLVTPTIKSDMYTTGRGGTGNMAKNDPTNPAIARGRQDVDSLPRRMSEGASHFGRGGAANTVRMTQEEVARAREENARIEQAAREKELQKEAPMEKIKGLAEKGKGMLTKGGKQKS